MREDSDKSRGSDSTNGVRGLSSVIIAKAVHPPWNEGVRVIARNIGMALESAGHSTCTISLSDEAYRQYFEETPRVQHIHTTSNRGAASDYVNLKRAARAANAAYSDDEPGVFHLVGAPLALSPLIHSRQRHVIAHIPISRHMYLSPADRLRAMLGWRVFDQWIDAYACTSRQISDDLAKQGYPAWKLHVVAPPIDVQRFRPMSREEARSNLHLDPEAFLVLYVGTVSPLRFPAEQVMNALKMASPTIPNLALEIFAPVATHDYNIRWAEDNVRRATGGPGVPANIRLQDLSEDEKVQAYNAADVVLLPFGAPVAVEPPLTLLEAMACQAPVVVSPYANCSRVVEDGVNGALYTSPESLAVRLEALYHAGPEGRDALGGNARATIVQDYSFQSAATALEKLWATMGMARAESNIAINQGTI